MIPTLVIGLREGLEAALIVGIVAAFLRTNGRSLVPMWIGVGSAVLLSAGVGVGLAVVEASLPQRQQEGLETVIGAIAVVFVTTMIVWMSGHSRALKGDLEREASAALTAGSSRALVVMAFLAVLKEGFETSVFLLATFSAAQSAGLAALGAVVGLAIAVGIGWAIYAGGVRINLSRFFRVTGAFLILVAAGLVVSTLRTAHEAGWLVAGQARTVDLSWLVAPGTVVSALLTGVLGIPADPRAIEVVGWFCYVVPVGAYVFWPRRWRPAAHRVPRVQLAVAGGLVVAAGVLVVVAAVPPVDAPASLRVVAADGTAASDGSAPSGGAAEGAVASGTVAGVVAGGAVTALDLDVDGAAPLTVELPADQATAGEVQGVVATVWDLEKQSTPADRPGTLTQAELVELNGGRLPIGVDTHADPGPFQATWATRTTTRAAAAGTVLLDAGQDVTTLVTLSGGGLSTPRTVTVAATGTAAGWSVAAADASAVLAALDAHRHAVVEHGLWGVALPAALLLAAALTAAAAWRGRRRLAAATSRRTGSTEPEKRGTIYVTAP